MGRRKYQTEKYRKFNGVLYARTYHFPTKKKAQDYAESLREKGWLARVVPHVGVYTVYKGKR